MARIIFTLDPSMHHVVIIRGPAHDTQTPFAKDGRVRAQIVGYEGGQTDRYATAIHFRGTVRNLAELNLPMPAHGAAKDGQLRGFVAENILEGLTDPVTAAQYLENPHTFF